MLKLASLTGERELVGTGVRPLATSETPSGDPSCWFYNSLIFSKAYSSKLLDSSTLISRPWFYYANLEIYWSFY